MAAAQQLVANRVAEDLEGAGFDVDTNAVTLVSPGGEEPLPLMSKARVASAILDRVDGLLIRQRPAQV